MDIIAVNLKEQRDDTEQSWMSKKGLVVVVIIL